MQKKQYFFVLFFLFLSNFIFSETVNFFTTEKKWNFESGLSFERGNNFATIMPGFDFSACLDMTEFSGKFGIKMIERQFDFFTEAVYAPTFWNCFNAGVQTVFHTLYYDNIFFETDFLTGIYLGYHTKEKFSCMANVLYALKSSRIFAIEDDVPFLNSNHLAVKTEFSYKPFNFFKIYFTFSSYSDYRYMLFLAPDFNLGFEFCTSKQIFIGQEFDVQYVDMFTLSSNLNSIGTRVYAKLEL